jgi:Zn-dependent alcohol dehydrogenase
VLTDAQWHLDSTAPFRQLDHSRPRRWRGTHQGSRAGTGFTDTFIRRGRYPDFKGPLPFTPGDELVGVVDETGPGVPAQFTNQFVMSD